MLPAGKDACARRGGACRGLTLVEVLIYTAIMSLLMTALYASFVLVLRYQRSVQSTLDLQSQAQMAAARLVSEVADANIDTIRPATYDPDNTNWICFLSPRDGAGKIVTNSSGAVLWQKWIGYYIDRSDPLSTRLMRGVIALPAATDILPPNPYGTLAAFLAASPDVRMVATHETALTLGWNRPKVLIALTFVDSVQNVNDNQICIEDGVCPRN